MIKNLKWTVRLGITTPILIVIVVFLAGGGHGYFEPIIFLFPFPSISILVFDEINLGFALIALIQYPIYGLLIDKIKNKQEVIRTGLAIIISHTSVAIVTYILRPEHFK